MYIYDNCSRSLKKQGGRNTSFLTSREVGSTRLLVSERGFVVEVALLLLLLPTFDGEGTKPIEPMRSPVVRKCAGTFAGVVPPS
mmetsp:Transcript_16950/g.42329  ORF Transcript_16950/g.42329 Transcript_16950/m.42329 type:complete len:84 (+) Transcript_16950:1374-1625(+)